MSRRHRRSRPTSTPRLCAAALVLACASGHAPAELPGSGDANGVDAQIELLDGQVLTGKLTAIREGKVRLDRPEQPQQIPLDELSSIRLGETDDLMQASRGRIVRTTAGDLLAAEKLTAGGEEDAEAVRFGNPMLGDVSLKLSSVSAVYLLSGDYTPAAIERKCAQYALKAEGFDMLVVEEDGKWVGLEGVVQGIGTEKIRIRYQDEDRTVDITKVEAIRLASKPADVAARKGFLLGKDGSRIGFSSFALTGRAFTIEAAGLGERRIPADRVGRVTVRSDRVVFLSELDPAAVEEHGFFDKSFGYRRNKSTLGTPLQLKGKTYANGLGMHSFCELSYDVAGKYRKFVAVVGIDDRTRGKGDAMFTVLGDGKPLGDPLRIRGGAEPIDLVRDVTDVKRLVLRVGFGHDKLGVGDHVALAAARLIK